MTLLAKDYTEFLQRRHIQMVLQSPYSQDLNMCDRWLFSHLKSQMKKSTFNCAEEMRDAALQVFHAIPKEHFIREGYKQLEYVIEKQGEYIV